jgi:hypothetical protein
LARALLRSFADGALVLWPKQLLLLPQQGIFSM